MTTGSVPVGESALGGQIAVITGGGTGIGYSVASTLARHGVRCVLVGRRSGVVAEAADRLVTPGLGIAADVTIERDLERVIERVRCELGTPSILVHAAGVFRTALIEDLTPEHWDAVLGVNLASAARVTHHFWSDLTASGGQILYVGSIAADQSFPGDAAYAASKGGLVSFARVVADEGRVHGVRVITLQPGQVDTPLWDPTPPPEVLERMMPVDAIGRLAVNLLASDRGLDYEPITVRPVRDPWTEPEA